jgi:sec-independent protein translocase protein TatA
MTRVRLQLRNLREDESGLLEGFDLIIILIVVAVLFLFGPKKLPEIFRSFGRALGEFRRGKLEIEQEIRSQFTDVEPAAIRDRLAGVATTLGVDSSTKTDGQIKIAIARALDRAPDAQLRTAARNLGVNLVGGDLEGLKQEILKALAL